MSPRTGDSGTPEIAEGEMKNCETCHGNGVAEVWDPETESYVEQNCTSCGGSGQVEGEDEMPGENICYGCGGEDGHEGPCMPPTDEEGEASCDYCGAPFGMPHEVGCHEEEDPRDPDREYDARVDRQAEGRVLETDGFDKFMDRIVGDEKQRAKADPKAENNPQRQIASRYQDRPMNKTRWGGHRG
jgi:hypothetical protein